jgi:hypothetical protein
MGVEGGPSRTMAQSLCGLRGVARCTWGPEPDWAFLSFFEGMLVLEGMSSRTGQPACRFDEVSDL